MNGRERQIAQQKRVESFFADADDEWMFFQFLSFLY